MNFTIKKRLITEFAKRAYDSQVYSLDYLNVNIIEGCISKCIMCDLWKNKVKKLSFADFSKALDIISSHLSLSKDIMISIGGHGEPMMNSDIFEIIKLCKNKGFSTSLVTNSLLITKNSAYSLISSGLAHINFSFESIDTKINDLIRNAKGHHKKVLKSIELLHKLKQKHNKKCDLGFLTTVCAKNICSIPDLVRYVNNNPMISSIRFQAITQPFGASPVKNWHTNQKYAFLWPKKSDVEKVYNFLIKIKNSSKIENSLRSLKTQKTYFLNPGKYNKHISKTCNVYQGAIMNVNGDITVCPMGENIFTPIGKNVIININNEKPNVYLIRKRLLKIQNLVKKCSMNNCHIMLNCNYTGKEQFYDKI